MGKGAKDEIERLRAYIMRCMERIRLSKNMLAGTPVRSNSYDFVCSR